VRNPNFLCTEFGGNKSRELRRADKLIISVPEFFGEFGEGKRNKRGRVGEGRPEKTLCMRRLGGTGEKRCDEIRTLYERI